MINSIDIQFVFKHSCTIVLLSAMVACGSVPVRLPVAREQAGKAEQAAHKAMSDGDLHRAKEMFRQTILLQQSIENTSAAAMSTINLSTINHKLGESAAAVELLNDLLGDKTGLILSEYQAVAAFRKGIILTDMNRFDEAESALQLASQLCQIQCTFVAGMNNLKARLLFHKGDYYGALELAKKVIKSGANKEEQANAFRMAGSVENELSQHGVALSYYKNALELDKDLALGNRIAEDLKGIAKALEGLGQMTEAGIYASRAENVSKAAILLKENSTKNVQY